MKPPVVVLKWPILITKPVSLAGATKRTVSSVPVSCGPAITVVPSERYTVTMPSKVLPAVAASTTWYEVPAVTVPVAVKVRSVVV